MKDLKKYIPDYKKDSEEQILWKFHNKDKAFEDFCELYDNGYGEIIIEDNLIEVHSGGWSDNEHLIYQLQRTFWWSGKNVIICSGGHFFIDLDRYNGDKKHWGIVKK